MDRYSPSFTKPLVYLVFFAAFLLTLNGCGGGSNNNTNPSSNRATEATSPILLANACFSVQLDDQFLTIDSASGTYSLSSEAHNPTPFYLKPSGLDKYLLFDNQHFFLAAYDTPIRTQARDMRLEWQAHTNNTNEFLLQSTQNQQWLSYHGSTLTLIDAQEEAAIVRFTPNESCATFPEASTNSSGEPSIGEFDDGAVWGVADVHMHLFGTLAFGGNIMAGDVFHPLGIQEALQDCSVEHGHGGRIDITGYVTGGETKRGNEIDRIAELPFKILFSQPLHKTDGYPNFTEWPNSSTTTHQMAYYKWLERAYLGGLRLVVNLLVESGPLCKVGKQLSKSYAPIDPNYQFDENIQCNGTATSERQLQATRELVNYIDAQHGGPGKGWLRIVETPQEARQVIKQKKLAMIIGSETPDLFSCINGVDGERPECTYEYIETKLDEYEEKGIRTIFPVHHYDNDFGGAYVFNPIIEAARVVQDGALFHYEACDIYDYKPILAIQLPSIYYMLFPNFMKDLPLFPFIPEADGYCNRRGLTDLGAHLIREMMARGMLIETAHMSAKMKEAVIEMAEYYDYPLIDTHMAKAFSEASKQREARYLSLGGVRAPLPNRTVHAIDNYQGVSKTCDSHTSQDLAIQLMAFSDARQDLGLDRGVVFGTDLHGMVQQSKPRFGEKNQCNEPQNNPVEYPFTSFDSSVVFDKQTTGNRSFDFNTDGLAHVGMLPDLIQDMRNQGMSDHYIEAFFRGAETYLQTWEKALQRSQALSEQSLTILNNHKD